MDSTRVLLNSVWAAALSLACVLLLSEPVRAAGAPPSLILRNGRIYTLDPARPWAQAIAVRGTRIVAVGTDESILGLALRAYTLDAAFASRAEKQEGSIEAGKMADIVLFSKNLLEIPPNDIPSAQVLLTVAGGRVVYRKL